MRTTSDPPRVLILARSATASAIAAGLTERTGAECIAPLNGGDADGSLHWLCAQLFPRPSSAKKSADPADIKNASLFEWTRFNLIVIEDVWVMQRKSEASTLEFAGPVFASFDYYDRGNFGARKAVLVSEAALFAERLGSTENTNGIELMRRRFDQKNAIEFIASDGGHGAVLQCLEQLLSTPPASAPNDKPIESAPIDLDNDLIEVPVLDAANNAIRASIEDRSEIILVEDEIEDIKLIYEGVSGKRWEYGPLAPGTVNVISSRAGPKGGADRYDDLLQHCEQAVRAAIGGDGQKTVIVVTDILFRPSSFCETGIDLIERLRQIFGRRIGIVAFTGFRTPFVTMMAYHRGADYVVEKGRTAARHPDVVSTGVARLLVALGFLYFERALLREKRRICKFLVEGGRLREESTLLEAMGHVLHLKETLPPHMVSMHLRPEWNDTYYLLRAIHNKWIPEEELPAMVKQIGATYDEFRNAG